MHHIHHTEGLILGSRGYGEAGKYYSIFTRDLGMIHASAQGVRKMSSKLRFVLQDFSYVKLDLVRGKDFWRLTSASKTNQLESISKNPETLEVFTNIARLLKRLLAGEYPNETLFADLINGLTILNEIAIKKITQNVLHNNANWELQNIEVIIVLRILNNLGYIGVDEKLNNLIHSPFEKELIFEVSKSRAKILSEINKALRETQL